MNTVILIMVLLGIYYLGKYAIEEGQRTERQKQFMKDMEEFDKNKKRKIK
jgi:hypothetical protein|tara:strand:+ start:313 stop:462 length:150 start_codon:yes stop_codon:yes gene_type:complete